MATTQDAELILHLYETRREPVLRAARVWFAREFNAKTLEELQAQTREPDPERYFRMMTTYWEMAASFLVRGAVDADLFLDNCGECLLVWRKMAPLVEALRASRNNPRYLANVEEVFRRFEARRAKA